MATLLRPQAAHVATTTQIYRSQAARGAKAAQLRRPSIELSAPVEGARRTLNVAVAVIGIILAAPLMLVIAALVRLTSRGPVLYTQTRIGLDRRRRQHVGHHAGRQANAGGKPFTIYKFRTMAAGGPAKQVWADPKDSRITALGRFLRRSRLDELPQLFNVLQGDMNVVGPRPEQPAIFSSLRESLIAYPRRQRVRPGITGWAQVNHHYDQSIEDVQRKLAYDLEYIRRQSPLEDLRIMWRTPMVMLGWRGGW